MKININITDRVIYSYPALYPAPRDPLPLGSKAGLTSWSEVEEENSYGVAIRVDFLAVQKVRKNILTRSS
jgi:hypothetical protein